MACRSCSKNIGFAAVPYLAKVLNVYAPQPCCTVPQPCCTVPQPCCTEPQPCCIATGSRPAFIGIRLPSSKSIKWSSVHTLLTIRTSPDILRSFLISAAIWPFRRRQDLLRLFISSRFLSFNELRRMKITISQVFSFDFTHPTTNLDRRKAINDSGRGQSLVCSLARSVNKVATQSRAQSSHLRSC